MRRFVTVVTFVCATLALGGCDNPKKVVLPTNLKQLDTIKDKVAKLPDEDKGLLTAYLMRASLGKAFGGEGIPPGTTIGQAIETQKIWVNDQKAKAAEADALKKQVEEQRAGNAKIIEQTATVALVKIYQIPKSYDANRFSDSLGIDVAVRNTGSKEIRGVSGRIIIIDVFDKPIATIGADITHSVAPGQTYVWSGSRKVNPFDAEDMRMYNLEEGKYTARFEPAMIVFSDGTKIGKAD